MSPRGNWRPATPNVFQLIQLTAAGQRGHLQLDFQFDEEVEYLGQGRLVDDELKAGQLATACLLLLISTGPAGEEEEEATISSVDAT